VKDPDGGDYPLLEWAPVPVENCQMTASTPEEMQKVFTGAAAHNLVYETKNLPLFKGIQTGNYGLNPAFPGAGNAMTLPAYIREMLALPVKYKPYTGSFPVK
jgi:hypothetical protein